MTSFSCGVTDKEKKNPPRTDMLLYDLVALAVKWLVANLQRQYSVITDLPMDGMYGGTAEESDL